MTFPFLFTSSTITKEKTYLDYFKHTSVETIVQNKGKIKEKYEFMN